MIMLELIETHCVSILTYGIEIIFVSNQDKRRQLRVAYNSVFRRIWDYRRFESVRRLQAFLGRPTWEDLLEKRIKKFETSIRNDAVLNAIFHR